MRWWTIAGLVLCAALGLVLAAALTHQGVETPLQHFYRCWGWYEGTYGGRQGAACPSWWPAGHP